MIGDIEAVEADRAVIETAIGHDATVVGEQGGNLPEKRPRNAIRHSDDRLEEIHQPVHRRLKRVKPASPPIHKRNIVLTGWTAAIARRCHRQRNCKRIIPRVGNPKSA